jgi:hypothetical protein
MSLDGIAEQEAIITRLSVLCGGRIYDSVPEEEELERDDDSQLVKPYIVVSFGDVTPTFEDRSLAGEEDQPQLMVTVVECWGATMGQVRRTAGAVRGLLVGWSAGPNSTQVRLGRGGRFTQTDAEGRPTRYLQTVPNEMLLNMATDQP